MKIFRSIVSFLEGALYDAVLGRLFASEGVDVFGIGLDKKKKKKKGEGTYGNDKEILQADKRRKSIRVRTGDDIP